MRAPAELLGQALPAADLRRAGVHRAQPLAPLRRLVRRRSLAPQARAGAAAGGRARRAGGRGRPAGRARARAGARTGELRLAGPPGRAGGAGGPGPRGRPGGARRGERAPRRRRGVDDGARGVLMGGRPRHAARWGTTPGERGADRRRLRGGRPGGARHAPDPHRARRPGRAGPARRDAAHPLRRRRDRGAAGRRGRRRGRRRHARRLDLPVHGRDGVPRDRDPARDAGVPRRVGRDARRRDGGRGADRDRPADRPGLGLLGGRGLGHVRASAAASGVPSCWPAAAASGSPSRGSRSSTPGSTTTARPPSASAAWCPWCGPSAPW